MTTNKQLHKAGRRLRLIRKDQGLNRKKMAAKYLLGHRALRRYETGGSVPGVDYLTMLSLDGYNISWLVTGEGEMSQFKRSAQDSQLNILRLWVRAMFDNHSCYRGWFRIELERRFPEFKAWGIRNKPRKITTQRGSGEHSEPHRLQEPCN